MRLVKSCRCGQTIYVWEASCVRCAWLSGQVMMPDVADPATDPDRERDTRVNEDRREEP